MRRWMPIRSSAATPEAEAWPPFAFRSVRGSASTKSMFIHEIAGVMRRPPPISGVCSIALATLRRGRSLGGPFPRNLGWTASSAVSSATTSTGDCYRMVRSASSPYFMNACTRSTGFVTTGPKDRPLRLNNRGQGPRLYRHSAVNLPPAVGAVGPKPHFDRIQSRKLLLVGCNDQTIGIRGLRPRLPEALFHACACA